jgi:acetate kinase
LQLAFLGVDLDEDGNAAAEPDADIASSRSTVRVVVLRAREDLVAARAARALLASDRGA